MACVKRTLGILRTGPLVVDASPVPRLRSLCLALMVWRLGLVRIEKCTKFRGLGFRGFRGFGGFGFTVEGLRLSVCDLGVKSFEGLGSFDFSRALRF